MEQWKKKSRIEFSLKVPSKVIGERRGGSIVPGMGIGERKRKEVSSIGSNN